MLESFSIVEDSPEEYIEKYYAAYTRSSVRHVCKYLYHRDEINIYFVLYERHLSSFEEELRQLLNYILISLDEYQIQSIKNKTSFMWMNQEAPFHIRKRVYGSWQQVLTCKQKNEILKISGSMLKLLHYLLQGTARNGEFQNFLPDIPISIDKKQISNMKSRRGRLTWLELAAGIRRLVAKQIPIENAFFQDTKR